MTDKNLHSDIERWFDGDMTVAEERALRKRLLSFEDHDETVDEALAVMGFSGIRQRKSKRMTYWKGIAAASIVALTGFGLYSLMVSSGMKETECYAYVGGERIDNQAAVLQLMENQLGEMASATTDISREVEDELEDFRVIFNN